MILHFEMKIALKKKLSWFYKTYTSGKGKEPEFSGHKLFFIMKMNL